ncbi:YebC/PmpR family DNA-binding transcriptional regulator [Caldalkalibacillus salinus]|uniref:YebC/PmpR family DNA-binding transcriptional regulator n=1 Tax=Caldalkalibacillus salinus TaxID=2803787 RepID=UPI00192436ED
MAGHSKWKNIQHRKGRQDARRAKVFTKISKEIFASVRSGGDDTTTNTRLRLALQKAKEANMPNDNIDRTIKKALGDVDGVQYEEILYEGYGPGGVAVMVEALTDNRNRSAADIRHIFNKNSGNLGETGCVSYLFERKGVLSFTKSDSPLSEEEVMLEALEAGAEDITDDESSFEIYTTPQAYEEVKEGLEAQGVSFDSSEITMVPATYVALHGEDAEQMLKLIDALEDNDDVQNVYSNVEMDNETVERLSHN